MVTTYNTLAELVAALDATFISAETKALLVAKAINDRVVCDSVPSFSLLEDFKHVASVPIFDGMEPYAKMARTDLKTIGITTAIWDKHMLFYFNHMPSIDEMALVGMSFGMKVMELYKNAKAVEDAVIRER